MSALTENTEKIRSLIEQANSLPTKTDGTVSYATEQTLTEEEQARARANISAIGKVSGSLKNIIPTKLEGGSIQGQTGVFTPNPNSKTTAASQEYVRVEPNKYYTVSGDVINLAYVALYFYYYAEDLTYLNYVSATMTTTVRYKTILIPENAAFVRVATYGEGGSSYKATIPAKFQLEIGTVATEYEDPTAETYDMNLAVLYAQMQKRHLVDATLATRMNPVFEQIAHRGYRASGAPECTAPAYVEAKLVGYSAGENDLQITSDGVFVMCHGLSLPNNSSVLVAENTYATLLSYNMGSFNGMDVKILKFEEWLVLMKKLGLRPYVDLKITLTEELAANAVGLVRRHGMLDDVTWSGAYTSLANIRAVHETARVAVIGVSSVTSGVQDLAVSGRPDLTVIYPQSIDVTADVVSAATEAGVGVECWHCAYASNGFTTEGAILAEVERVVDLGVTGICLDTYLPGDYFVKQLTSRWGFM